MSEEKRRLAKENHIFVLTMVNIVKKNGEHYRSDTRMLGLHYDFNRLEEAVLSNEGDMFECLYDYAVIEEAILAACSGYRPPISTQWYKANWSKGHPNEPESIVKMDEPPDFAANTFNWWG